jgi:hypothetical protein
VQVSGVVQTEQAPNRLSRVVLAGWEDRAADRIPGTFTPLEIGPKHRGVPVVPLPY